MSTPSHKDKVEIKFNLLPYGSNVGAPNITKEDVSVFLQNSTTKYNHFVEQKFDELMTQMNNLVNSYKLNEVVYNSEIRFEPIMGDTYFLYERKNGQKFLSMITPQEWKMSYICTVRLNTDGQWVLIEGTYPNNQ